MAYALEWSQVGHNSFTVAPPPMFMGEVSLPMDSCPTTGGEVRCGYHCLDGCSCGMQFAECQVPSVSAAAWRYHEVSNFSNLSHPPSLLSHPANPGADYSFARHHGLPAAHLQCGDLRSPGNLWDRHSYEESSSTFFPACAGYCSYSRQDAVQPGLVTEEEEDCGFSYLEAHRVSLGDGQFAVRSCEEAQLRELFSVRRNTIC